MKIKKFENFDTKENAEDIFEEFIDKWKLKEWVVSKYNPTYHRLPIYFEHFDSEKQIFYSIDNNSVDIFYPISDYDDYIISEEDRKNIYDDFSYIKNRMEKFGFEISDIERIEMNTYYSDGRDVEGECLYFKY